MTKNELGAFARELKRVFEIVRLVDVSQNIQYQIAEDGALTEEPSRCYAVWHKDRRCENCISAKAYAERGKLTKFEFVEDRVYFVLSLYLELEGQPYMLEMVSVVTDEALFGAYGRDQFAETISEYNRKLYIDPLTGAYNRRYFEEQLLGLKNECAVAMVDVDHFKEINDTYGHRAGDLALQSVVESIQARIRSSDAVIRYGGDEFLIGFGALPRPAFLRRLEEIREAVSRIAFPDYPELHLSISIGGKYTAEGGRPEQMIREADKLLYQAKSERNRVRAE